jgi:hypothetical protein
MPRDMSWIDDLSPDEAQAALDTLATQKGPLAVREAVEFWRTKKKVRG